MKSILCLVLMLPALCFGQWTEEQKGFAATALAVTAIDYGQTRYIAKTPGFYENNPIIGKHPKTSRVNTYFVAAPILTYLVLDHLSSEERSLALKIILAVEIGFVAHNYSLGIRTSF